MADMIRVNTDLLERCASELKTAAQGFGEAAAILARLDTGEEWWEKMGKFSDLKLEDEGGSVTLGDAGAAVRALTAVMRRYDTRVTRLGEQVSGTAGLFSSVESDLAGKIQGQSAGDDPGYRLKGKVLLGATAGIVGPGARKGSVGKTINKIIGKMGYLGKVVSFFATPVANWYDTGVFGIGATGAKAVATILKDGVSTLSGLSDWSKSNKNLERLARMDPGKAKRVGLKRLFGLNDMFAGKASRFGWSNLPANASWFQKATATSDWGSRFYNNFNKLGGPLDAYKSGGAKAAFAWAGLGLSFVSNAVSNHEEHSSGKISTQRAVAETFMETAVDVGKNWLVGTAVAAGVAATVGSAPVLVVGAATVGVTMGMDWACKKITGKLCGEEKGVTETVSDLVLDVGKGAYVAGKKAVSGITSYFKNMGADVVAAFS